MERPVVIGPWSNAKTKNQNYGVSLNSAAQSVADVAGEATMDWSAAGAHRWVLGAVWRSPAFLILWLILYGADPAGFIIGIGATIAATWTSLRLLPPGELHPSFAGLAGLALRFFRQSIVAGVDVAWRALDPRLPLRPGFVVCPMRSPPGPMRSAFCMMSSLLPGTLPTGPDDSGAIVIHCLDVGQPVVSQTTAEEELFLRALGTGTLGTGTTR
jgi:multicomponent Na+:H+ antiporter subunit E